MQQTGSLKKRRKRNITKVAGLGLIPYDADQDILEDHFTNQISNVPTNKGSGTGRQKSGRSYFKINMDMPNTIPEYEEDEDDLNENWGNEPTNFKRDNDLPYMLSMRTITRMRSLILLGKTSGAFPWTWNWKTYKIEEWSAKYKKLWNCFWILCSIQSIFLTMYQLYSFGQILSSARKTKTYRTAFQASFSVLWYCYFLYFNANMYLYGDAMRQYVNTMFHMNKQLVDKYVISMEGYLQSGCILIDWAIPSNTCQVFVCGMPYEHWFLQHYIYTPEQPWWYRIPGALHEYILIGQALTSYMFNSWIVFAHTNTVKFWLQEMHCNYDTAYTTNELRKRTNAMQVFQSLQILCTLFNDCMAPMAVPAVKFCIASALIPSGYVLINSMGSIFFEEFPGILTYPFGVFDTVTIGFAILASSAEMFDLSVSFVDSWSRTKHKDFRRLLKSFPTLKVRVGRFYFITVSTTVTYFKVTLDKIIDCIITF